jgi:hypothetical protein
MNGIPRLGYLFSCIVIRGLRLGRQETAAKIVEETQGSNTHSESCKLSSSLGLKRKRLC